jgi:septum formation protein
MQFILGSASPRRVEILKFFSLPFEQISSHFDEDAVPYHGNPGEHAALLAKGKGEALAIQYPEAIILTADTVVSLNGQLFGKPENETKAFESLQELAGKRHSVYTAVAVWKEGQLYEGVQETKVLMNPLSPAQINRYLTALHWADKAGGYAIQLAGSLLVRSIEGCYYNVMGLPINTLAELLKKAGIDLWDHLS